VEDGNVARSTAEALLDDQIRRLAGASESLSSALRKPVIRGSWGEMTLENALENAGLRAEIDFVLQHSTDGEDGRKRTDAIINLPKGRKLIIDSKNLMESYIAYSIAEDPAEKALLQAAHSRSLKNHIKDLSSKEYWRRYDGVDCVILFLPHDGMYHAAMQDEAELIRDACEKRVFVTNPMSLVFLLKAVGYVLDQERANKSAEAIRNLGSDLYAELARFAASVANIGSKLQASVRAYNDAIPGLDRFIVTKARNLKQLGAGKGAEAELPEPVDLEPRLFSSRELKTTNLFLQPEEDETELSLAATIDEKAKEG
jgi:DNA recombination protein RmuC